MELQRPCPSCGARNAADAEWCSQCYRSLSADEVEDDRAEAAGEEERRFAHPTEYASLAGKPVYSRWAGSETSFGPFGRIVLTLLVIAVGVGLGFNYSPVPVVIWVFLATPVLLRSIWKRVPIRYEHAPVPARPVSDEDSPPEPAAT